MKELDKIILESYKDKNTINFIYGFSKTYKTSLVCYIANMINKHITILDVHGFNRFTDDQNAAIVKDKLIKRFADLTIKNKVILLEYPSNKLLEKYPMLLDVFLNYCQTNNCILFIENYGVPNRLPYHKLSSTIINMVRENKTWFEKLFRLDRVTVRFIKNRYHNKKNVKINTKYLSS